MKNYFISFRIRLITLRKSILKNQLNPVYLLNFTNNLYYLNLNWIMSFIESS